MKRLLFSILCLMCCSLPAQAQTDFSKEEINLLKSDYKQVAAVAHVQAKFAEILGEPIGYVTWRLRGAVVEAFKGKLSNSAQIEFFAVVEAGHDAKHFIGEKIVFLARYRDKASRAPTFSALENSTRPAEARYLQFFRKLTAKQPKSRNRN